MAAALVARYGIPVFARKWEDDATYYRHVDAALDHRPQITMDDGADLVSEMHKKRPDLLPGMLGGTEETTTGVIRLRAMKIHIDSLTGEQKIYLSSWGEGT